MIVVSVIVDNHLIINEDFRKILFCSFLMIAKKLLKSIKSRYKDYKTMIKKYILNILAKIVIFFPIVLTLDLKDFFKP